MYTCKEIKIKIMAGGSFFANTGWALVAKPGRTANLKLQNRKLQHYLTDSETLSCFTVFYARCVNANCKHGKIVKRNNWLCVLL